MRHDDGDGGVGDAMVLAVLVVGLMCWLELKSRSWTDALASLLILGFLAG